MPEAGVQVFMILLFLLCLEKFTWRHVIIREGVSIHDIHIVNTVCPYMHRSRISISSFYSVSSLLASGLLLSDPFIWAFPSCTTQPGWMRRSLRMYNRVKDFLFRLETPSQSSLWQVVTRPTFLQFRAWDMDKVALHPSQLGGMSGRLIT